MSNRFPQAKHCNVIWVGEAEEVLKAVLRYFDFVGGAPTDLRKHIMELLEK